MLFSVGIFSWQIAAIFVSHSGDLPDVSMPFAAMIGSTFGYMAKSPNADNFYHFVTAHAPVTTSVRLGAPMTVGLPRAGGVVVAADLRHAG